MKTHILITAACILSCIIGYGQTDCTGTRARQSVENARQLRRLFKTDEAIDTLMAALQYNISDIEVLTELAECHTSAGNTEEAFVWWTMLSNMQPENLQYQIAQAQLLYREKAYEECAETCKRIIAKDTIPNILAMTGDAYRYAGKADSALVYYNRFLKIKPFHAKTVSKKADILLAAGKHIEVLEMTRSFLDAQPDDMTILPIHGLALHLGKKYRQSLAAFEKLQFLGDSTYSTHYYLGLNHYMMDNILQAEREFEKAYQIDSSDVTLVYHLADTKSRRYYGTNPEVEHLYDKALKMLEPDPIMMHNIYGSRAMSFHRAEDFRTAIRYYEQSYRYNSKNISALSSIGYCYERLKEYDKALEYYERYLKLGKPGSKGYQFVEESIAYIRQEKFMEETE